MPLAHLLPSLALASFQFDPNSDQFLIIQLIVQLVVGLIFAIVCASLAPGRGRSAVGWFFIGLFFTCVGLIILLLIPNLKLEAEKQRRRDAETRRLREQLKKERQVADQRHEAHSQRLGAHDRAIGVDTAPQAALADSDAPSAAAEDAPATVAAEWFYAVDGERSGPVSGPELRALWLDEKIPDNTIVWREGMADWLPIGEVGDILGDS
ncbi:MAG: DUF4339 domain-containing protein [Planctomycetes bacterium]|nr:DUF4339 domain-containing protein [Planctomycetota bacterium]